MPKLAPRNMKNNVGKLPLGSKSVSKGSILGPYNVVDPIAIR